MIQFTLKCENDHRFDSWFQSATAFDKLHAGGMVTCAVCGSAKVEKALMAPRVQAESRQPDKQSGKANLRSPASPAEQALAELRKKIEANAENVGRNFAREARDMHDGLTPERPIYGEARTDEARKLIEDGVPVTPIPFMNSRKSN